MLDSRRMLPARNKIALWSVVPGAAIVIIVGSLFWASVWIAFRTPTTRVVSVPSETASVPGADSVPGETIASEPADDNRTVTFATVPSDAAIFSIPMRGSQSGSGGGVTSRTSPGCLPRTT